MANGKLYSLHVEGFGGLDGQLKRKLMNLKGQAKVVFEEMVRDRRPRSIPEIAKAVAGKFTTTQTDEKVVGYYVVSWRSQGIVRAFAQTQVTDESVDSAFEELVAKILEADDEQEALTRAEAAEE